MELWHWANLFANNYKNYDPKNISEDVVNVIWTWRTCFLTNYFKIEQSYIHKYSEIIFILFPTLIYFIWSWGQNSVASHLQFIYFVNMANTNRYLENLYILILHTTNHSCRWWLWSGTSVYQKDMLKCMVIITRKVLNSFSWLFLISAKYNAPSSTGSLKYPG